MFIPKHFQVSDSEEIDRFIARNAFGVLVSSHDQQLVATHLPVHRVSENLLQAHVARANPQWQQIDGQEVLLILSGPHDYVSPTWYEEPGVPTWNYQAVHIYASVACFTDTDRLKELVLSLSNEYESSRANPWPGEFDARMLKAIVGIDLTIKDIQCKYKLSQNRSENDQRNVIAELEQAGNVPLAQAMKELNK